MPLWEWAFQCSHNYFWTKAWPIDDLPKYSRDDETQWVMSVFFTVLGTAMITLILLVCMVNCLIISVKK